MRACNFTEQPRILDRDDRPVGKGAHQFDLPLGVRLDPLPREIDRAENLPLAQERRPKPGAYPRRDGLGEHIVRVSAVVRMHHPALDRHPPGDGVATGNNGSLA